MKRILHMIAGYVLADLGCAAEYGQQQTLSGFKTNSSYTALGNKRYIAVMATAAGQANQATNANSSTLLGVMQNNPDVGEAMTIAYAGLSKMVAGGAVTALNIITTNASGRAAAVTSGQMAMGRALEAAGADGDVFSVLLFHPVRWGQVA